MNLARTELVVRPCVALLHTSDPPVPVSSASPAPSPTVEESLIPRLDAKEVAAVFSAPFHNFLCAHDEQQPQEGKQQQQQQQQRQLPPGNWYEGSWTQWHDQPWRMHFFYVPVAHQRVVKPRVREGGLAALSEHEAEEAETGRYKVWGMTARMLVDAATVAYGEPPEFEHNTHFGDEGVIEGLYEMGRLGEKKRLGSGSKPREVGGAVDVVREVEWKKGEASKM